MDYCKGHFEKEPKKYAEQTKQGHKGIAVYSTARTWEPGI